MLLDTLRRGARRILLLGAIGLALLAAAHVIPTLLGPTGAPLALVLGFVFVGFSVGEFAVRALQPRIDAQSAGEKGIGGNAAAAIVYLGTILLRVVIIYLCATAARAGELPSGAIAYGPILRAEVERFAGAIPHAARFAGQVEQETGPCPRGRHCWNVRAELKTSREQGIGLGQMTRAWRADGSLRFDALSELVASFPKELDGLSWENRYDPTLQARALVLKDVQIWRTLAAIGDPEERWPMMLATYNGGSLASDRRVCAATPGCDDKRWWGNVERTSLKSKTAVPGYSKSWFAINREYPRFIIHDRAPRYVVLMEG